MAKWGTYGNKGTANVQGVVYLTAAAANPARARVFEWTIGCNATPADNTFVHICQRATTTSLVGSTTTPNALDPADTLASTIVSTSTVTTDGTLTAGAFLMNKAVNQRATFRWVAVPYGELIIPATASNGFMFGLSAANTTTMSYDFIFGDT